MNLTPEEVHKMKVVELRAELANRGLDSKGVKAVLAERLIAALDQNPSAPATNLGNGNAKAEASVEDGSHQEEEAEKVGKGEEQEDEEEKDNGDVQLTSEEEEKLLAGNGDDEAGGEEDEEEDQEEAPEEENLGDEETDEGTGEELKDEDESAGQVKDDKAEAEKMESEEAKSDEKVEVSKDEKAEVSKDEKVEEESKDEEAEGSKEVEEPKKVDGAEDESMEVDQESNKRKIDEVQGENEEEKEEKPEKKRQRTEEIKVIAEHEPEIDEEQVLLDWYKSDLNLKISEENYLEATPWNIEEFPFAYAGVKGTYGFQSGKVYYEATWEESAEIKLDFGEEEKKYLLRVGWSDLSAGLQLGQDKLSYGLDSSGKVYKGGVAEDSDVTFEKGDVIGTILDLDADPVQIKFTKNGEIVGPTVEIPREELAEKTLFPHILTRNVKFVVNFGEAETKYTPEEGVILASKVEADKRVRGPIRGAARTDCEFVMLVGLAGCGKTKWAKDYVEANVDKHYNILGTSTLVERSLQDQKILGSSSTSRTYDGFFQKAGKFVEKLVEIAPSRRRNFILDQSNVVPGAQRRKSSGFQGFIRRAVVIVPSDEEYQNRIKSKEQEQGKSVPKSTILDMKAGFRLPDVGEIFTAVDFADLDREEAQKLISKYNKEGQAAGYGRPIQTRGGGMRAGRGRGRGGPRGSYNRGGGGGWRGGPMGGGGGRPYGGPPRGGGGGPRGMGPMRGGPRGGGGGPRGGGGGGGLPRGASRGGSLPRFQRGGPPRGGGGGGGSWRGDSVPMRSSGPPLRGGKRDFGGGRGGGGGSWRGGNGNVVQGGGRGGYGGGGGGPRNPQQQGFQNWGQSWGPPGRSTAGGGFGGGFAGSGGDPWQQVPDQGFGQSWDSSAGGRSGGGGGGGTWQNYGGQTFGGNYGNRR